MEMTPDAVNTKQIKMIHTVPEVSEEERKRIEKRISHALFEVFLRIREKLG